MHRPGGAFLGRRGTFINTLACNALACARRTACQACLLPYATRLYNPDSACTALKSTSLGNCTIASPGCMLR